jgi:tRNA 2-thiocytidine biosynthesis protein TtcA
MESLLQMSAVNKNRFKLNRSRKNLRRGVGRAIADYNMIEDGDLIMVCLSGGKDSYTMLDILLTCKNMLL